MKGAHSSVIKGNIQKKKSCKRKRRKKSTSGMRLNKMRLILENEREDKELARLEKNLKLTKKSALRSKAFCDDGLDYLLETCDKVLTKSKTSKTETEKISSITNQGESERGNLKLKRKKSKENVSCESSASKTGSWAVSELDEDDVDNSEVKREPKSVKFQISEDDEDNNVPQKPKLDEPLTEKQINLKRQVKGLLNRLTEANMHKIVMQLEAVYSSNSRNSVNKILMETIMSSVGSSVRTPERLIQESAMLIAILHGIIDMSVGVMTVHTSVKEMHSLFMKNCNDECKKLDNLTLFIAHLYNFRVIDDVLIYDFLNLLAERFSEKDIELILSLLRTVGIGLRKSNSVQLKELILKLQKKASDVKELDSGFRVKYMLEVVLAIKNNNMQKIPNYDPDHVEHLKKLMKGFIPPGISLTQIKIPLEEMLKVEEHGHLLQNLTSGNMSDVKNEINYEKTENPQMDTVSKLLKKHRMNTDVRRQIFSIITTAEDYLDAFEKLVQLNFKDQQAGEVLNLILHCALQGKVYNPFYHLLACKLCTSNRKFLLSLQYSLWDKLDDLNALKRQQISNLPKFVAHCIIDKSLSLSSLKVLDFSIMDQQMRTFLKDVMLNILRNSSDENFEFICKRISSSQHAVFRESLWLYVKHVLSGSEEMESSSESVQFRKNLDVMHRIFGF